MHDRLARRIWDKDRPALAILAAGSLLAAIGWRATTRPMADTVSYRAGARILADGWPQLMDRTPGYPLVLLATGSSDRSTQLLFVAQLALHALAVVLVVDIGRLCGLGRRGTAAIALLLVAPPVMLRVVHEGTEATAAALLTVLGWLLIRRPLAHRPMAAAVAIGATCAAAALVRPTFALVWLPAVAVFTWSQARGRRGTAAAVALATALVPVVALVAHNAVRFDSASLTPLTAYHLSSRTSAYVEELPDSYEPARSVLIRYRDEALLRGEESAPTNFVPRARPELAEVTGLDGPELDRYLLEMNLYLISRNPLDYTSAVFTSALNYTTMDSQPAVLGVGRGVAQVEQAIHLVGGLGAVAAMACVPGLWLAGRVPRPVARSLVVALVLIGYTGLISVMVESGTARLRAPSEPLLALVVVVSASLAWQALLDRRAAAPSNS